jgi:hypothetical protein
VYCKHRERLRPGRIVASNPFALFHPQQQQWADHFAWNEEGTEIISLMPTGQATIAVLRMNRPQLIRLRRMWVKMGEHPPRLT